MLVILCVIDTLSTPVITEPPSVECQDLLIPYISMHMRRGNRSVRTSVFSLFRRTRAAQNVAPMGFKPGTSRMPGKRCTTMLHLPISNNVLSKRMKDVEL